MGRKNYWFLVVILLAVLSIFICTNIPFQLGNVKIPKPWGYETWYTGVEKRGIVKVLDKNGKTELPYSLNLFKKQNNL